MKLRIITPRTEAGILPQSAIEPLLTGRKYVLKNHVILIKDISFNDRLSILTALLKVLNSLETSYSIELLSNRKEFEYVFTNYELDFTTAKTF